VQAVRVFSKQQKTILAALCFAAVPDVHRVYIDSAAVITGQVPRLGECICLSGN
jgi:hypothetical protein